MTMKVKRRAVIPAERYDAPKDLWVVSTFFDSEGYKSKLRALQTYLSIMEKSNIKMILVEGAFRKHPFVLPESDKVIHVRCPSIMWQKERLLNVAIEHLPNSCKKVAWLDTDIFFENPQWAVETAKLLDTFPIVQPFDMALWLPARTNAFRGRGIAWPGFAAIAHKHPGLYLSGDFDRHGHTGYAWAARRDLIQKHGLYDRSIAGSGDHLMAHAMMGDLSSPCVTNSVGAANAFRDAFHAWAKPFHQDVHSRVGFVRGAVLHRWHGDRKKRHYYKRMVGLLAREYNPSLDVRVASSGALEWTEHGATLDRWLKNYFTRRQEDGKPGPVKRVPWDYLDELMRDASSPLDEDIRPFASSIGPLATLVAERSEDWIGAGLIPVLPNIVTALVLNSISSSTIVMNSAERPTKEISETTDSFKTANLILEKIMDTARKYCEMSPTQWKQMTPERRWALLSGIPEGQFNPLSEELKTRMRDPRWNDASELKKARKQLRSRRAKCASIETTPNPYDAVVGPGSAVTGLDHV